MKAVFMALLIALVWVGAQPAFSNGKNNPEYSPSQIPRGLLEGGETFASAQHIFMPFSGGGNTCDNANDYDAACPHTGSTAPDVVYSFEPERRGLLYVDLCGSSYDTKLMLYNQYTELIACNDDYYADDECGMYVSCLKEILVQPGQRYFLVVDGYGLSCGDYLIQMDLHCVEPACADASCPDNGLLEGEGQPGPDYVDHFNGGCDADEPIFQELFQLPGYDFLNFCGYTGWYLREGNYFGDSDWLKVVATGNVVTLEAQSSHHLPIRCDVIRQQACEYSDVQEFEAGICKSGLLQIPTEAGEAIYFRVRPLTAEPGPCAAMYDLYHLKISGIFGTVVSTENLSWDSIKSFYR